MSRAVMRQALELLERYRKETPLGHQPHMIAEVADKAIAAIRAALVEDAMQELSDINQKIEKIVAESEPVAWMWPHQLEDVKRYGGSHSLRGFAKQISPGAVPVYTAPVSRKPMTEDEIRALLDDVSIYDLGTDDLIDFARAIEKAHGIKEKNT